MRMSIFSVQDHYPTQARTVPELYKQILAQAELADQLGYDTFWVAEHHFHEYGAVPNPAIMLASIAQRTKRLRLGTAISILTFHNPLTVAESYAMVDILSDGRLMYGVGSGYLAHEFEGYAVDPAEKRDRFDETLAAVKQLLSGQRTSYTGKFRNFSNVKLNIEPVQKPIPIFVAVLRKEVAYYIGKQGNNLLCVPYASVDRFEDIADIVSEFRRGRAESGVPAMIIVSRWRCTPMSRKAIRRCVKRRKAHSTYMSNPVSTRRNRPTTTPCTMACNSSAQSTPLRGS